MRLGQLHGVPGDLNRVETHHRAPRRMLMDESLTCSRAGKTIGVDKTGVPVLRFNIRGEVGYVKANRNCERMAWRGNTLRSGYVCRGTRMTKLEGDTDWSEKSLLNCVKTKADEARICLLPVGILMQVK